MQLLHQDKGAAVPGLCNGDSEGTRTGYHVLYSTWGDTMGGWSRSEGYNVNATIISIVIDSCHGGRAAS